jgi:hypothetical protein
MRVLRWALLVPLAIAAWYAVFATGLFTHFYVEQHFCPSEDLVSGFCQNQSMQIALTVLMHTFTALSAAVVCFSAVLVAPSHKEPVVWIAFVIGLLIATCFGFMARDWSLFVAAAIAGAVAATAITFSLRARASHSKSNRAER